MLEAIHKLMSVAGWDYRDFRRAMGSESGRKTVFSKKKGPDNLFEWLGGASGSAAFEYYNFFTNENVIAFYPGAFSTRAWLKVVTVHELAHAWDSSSGDTLSAEMMKDIGGHYDHNNEGCLAALVGTTSCTPQTRYDWDKTKGVPLSAHGVWCSPVSRPIFDEIKVENS